jgi:dATP pyrophosphohydrolase
MTQVTTYIIEAHIFRKNSKGIEFLMLKRSEDQIFPNIWQMVTGSIREGEKAYETALREIKEETGLIPDKFWVAPTMNSFYSAKRDVVGMVPVFAAQVNPKYDVTISEEHSEYQWLSKEEAKKILAWKGQRTSVDVIHEYFSNEDSVLNFTEISLE